MPSDAEYFAGILKSALSKNERTCVQHRLRNGYSVACGRRAYLFADPPCFSLEALASEDLSEPDWDDESGDYEVPDEWRERFQRLCTASRYLVPDQNPNYVGHTWEYTCILAQLVPIQVRVAVEIST